MLLIEGGKETREDKDEMEFNGLANALNDLAKGQKEMLHALNRWADKSGEDQHSLQITQGDRKSTCGTGIQAHTNM